MERLKKRKNFRALKLALLLALTATTVPITSGVRAQTAAKKPADKSAQKTKTCTIGVLKQPGIVDKSTRKCRRAINIIIGGVKTTVGLCEPYPPCAWDSEEETCVPRERCR
jgi:hypothetical protein